MADPPDADPDDLEAEAEPEPEPEADALGDEVATNGAGDSNPDPDPDPETDDSETIGLIEARKAAVQAADDLLEHEFEGVVGVDRTDEGWRALVEVVERSAVPDTQDIIGRYEIELAADGSLTGYGLSERYRRGDMREEL